MAGYGPPRTSEDRRHKRKIAAVQLPSEGRTEPAPAWPLTGAVAPAWEELWTLPQAVEWERGHLLIPVARYARLLARAEAADASAAIFNEVRQLEDRLGLSSMSLHRLNWKIVDFETSPSQDASTKPAGRADEMRRKLRVV